MGRRLSYNLNRAVQIAKPRDTPSIWKKDTRESLEIASPRDHLTQLTLLSARHLPPQVLPTLRPALTEMMVSYYHLQSLNETLCSDVMATVMASVVAEMTLAVKKVCASVCVGGGGGECGVRACV